MIESGRKSIATKRPWWSLVAFVSVVFWVPAALATESATQGADGRYQLVGPNAQPDAAARKRAATAEASGKEAAKLGDCEKALPLFAEAYGAAGADSALTAALDCRVSAGQWLEARDLAEQLLKGTPESSKLRAGREQRLAEISGHTAELVVHHREAGARVSVDGQAVADTSPNTVRLRVLPGKHELHAEQNGFSPHQSSVNVEAGQSVDVDVVLVAEQPAATVDRKEVLDFCYLQIPRSTTRSQKQRLVLFSLAGRDVAFKPETEVDDKGKTLQGVEHHVLRDINVDSHVRSVFRSAFLMERFYTVEASIESPLALAKKKFLSDAELINATEVDPFAAYSLACTDWVILPRLTEKTGTWQKVKVQKTVNGRTVEKLEWHLDITWTVESDVYHRVAGGFSLAATVEGSNGGLLGAAFGLAAAAPHKDPGGKATPTLLSKRPQPGCNPPLLPELSELANGMSSCASSLGGLAEKAKRALDAESGKPTDTPPASSDAAKERAVAKDATGLRDGVTAKDGAALKPYKDLTATETKEAPKEDAATQALSEEEKATLQAVAAADPAAVARLVALGAAAKHPEVVAMVQSAQGAASSCKQPITAVTKVSEKLRDISQKGPAALGLPVLLGLASCVGVDLDVDLSTASPPGTDELDGKYCAKVDADVSRGAAAMQDVAACQSRVAMERSALAVKKHVKEVDGIRMFAPLLPPSQSSQLFGIALGRSEGVERGDAYVAFVPGVGGKLQRVGFGRIQEAGPGGEQGDQAPSRFKFRQGDGEVGARMEEHPQIGVPLAIEPRLNFFLLKGALATRMAIGGAIEGGYNASKFVPVGDEVWGRACLSFLAGKDKETFATIELGPDVVRYLGGGLAARAGTGFAFVVAMKDAEVVPGTTEKLTGSTAAAYLNAGLEYAFDPDWLLRVQAGYRQGVGSAKLENKAKTVAVDGGSLSAAQLGLLAGYTF